MEWRKKNPIYEYDELQDGITTILSRIHGIDDVDRFLNPSEEELYSPHLLKGIDKLVIRIDKAINEDEKIIIHTDIDGDGETSGALFFKYLKNFTENIEIIHHQRSAGHGIEYAEHLIPNDCKLLIIIDSSSNSVESCERISKKGIDIIIIDHHKIERENPYSILINPHQNECEYPNKNVSASLLSWKVCKVLDEYFVTNYSTDLIDLSAIGLIGDAMSLLEMENRYVVKEGMANIKNNGLKFLLKNISKDIGDISTQDIAYSISPSLNACARMDKLELGIELLTNDNEFITMSIASRIVKLNEDRKRQQSNLLDKLLPLANEILENDQKCVILINNEIGAGYRGLVANDIANECYIPTMILSCDNEGICRGSYRAGSDFDLRTFLNNCPEIIYAAGHSNVGGLSFHIDNVDKIYEYFNLNFKEERDRYLEYIYELDVNDLNEAFVRDVESFYRISGQGFPTGLFKVTGINVSKRSILGELRNTIKLTDKNSGISIMKFRTKENYITEYIIGKNIEVIGQLNLNTFNGKTYIQIFMDDYRVIE